MENIIARHTIFIRALTGKLDKELTKDELNLEEIKDIKLCLENELKLIGIRLAKHIK